MFNIGGKEDNFINFLLGNIQKSDLSEPLKTQMLSQLDVIDYKGLMVVRLKIPAQKQLSFVGKECFYRENSKTIKVEGFFSNGALNCASPASITIPFKIPTLFPNGYDDPNKVNIDKIELISPLEAKITFHGSFDSKGYEMFQKEQGKAYKSIGKNYAPAN